jgi:hypothetical protein
LGFKLDKLPRGKGGGDRVLQPTLEVGTYPGRLVQFIDLGIQPQRPYKGEEKPPAHLARLVYEFGDVFMVDKDGNELEDKPRWINETIPMNRLEADLAKSTKRYKALDPNMDFDGDFAALVGQPCMITIVHGENKKDLTRPYENIGNISTMRAKEAAKAAPLKNPTTVFLLDEPDMEIFHKLPSWLTDEIKGNLGFSGSALEAALKGGNSSTKGKQQEAPVDAPDEGDSW